MHKHSHTNRCTPELPYIKPATAKSSRKRRDAKRTARAEFWARMQERWAATA